LGDVEEHLEIKRTKKRLLQVLGRKGKEEFRKSLKSFRGKIPWEGGDCRRSENKGNKGDEFVIWGGGGWVGGEGRVHEGKGQRAWHRRFMRCLSTKRDARS